MGLFTPDDQAKHAQNARPERTEEESQAESRRQAYARLPAAADKVAADLARLARQSYARGERLQPGSVYVRLDYGVNFQSVDEADVEGAVARRLNELSGFHPTWKVSFGHGSAYTETDPSISISPVAGTF